MTNAERLERVNIVLLAICVPLLVLCLVRGLWVPAVVFTVFTASNGFQLWTGRRDRRRTE